MLRLAQPEYRLCSLRSIGDRRVSRRQAVQRGDGGGTRSSVGDRNEQRHGGDERLLSVSQPLHLAPQFALGERALWIDLGHSEHYTVFCGPLMLAKVKGLTPGGKIAGRFETSGIESGLREC
jgi:hypothetical protein